MTELITLIRTTAFQELSVITLLYNLAFCSGLRYRDDVRAAGEFQHDEPVSMFTLRQPRHNIINTSVKKTTRSQEFSISLIKWKFLTVLTL